MNMRIFAFGLSAGLCIGLAGGAPATLAAETPKPATPPGEVLARLHWLGKKHLAGQSNAAAFMAVWNLPESQKLENQTLDKLALALASSLEPRAGNQPSTPSSRPAVRFLRPLLQDLLSEESCLEVRPVQPRGCELALAIRLDDARAALWSTNLSAALESLSAARSLPAHNTSRLWQLAPRTLPARVTNQLALARAGGWTILGLAPERSASDPHPSTLDELLARIQRPQAPFPPRTTNFWLEADFDLERLLAACGLAPRPEANWPTVVLTAIGDGAWVRSAAQLTFPKPLPLELEPWCLPTNLICGPISGFTAVRGIRPALASLPAWHDPLLGPPPNQFFSWGILGLPTGTAFAALQPQPSNQVAKLTGLVLEHCNAPSLSNSLIKFQKSRKSDGLEWRGLPYLSPFLRSATSDGGEYVFGGFFPVAGASSPLPPQLLQELLAQTNLVLYDWEITGQRIIEWLHIGQTVRLIVQTAQLPPQSASVAWIKAVGAKLGPCGTEVIRTAPQRLSVKRSSAVGFTALELHLLVEWLESPRFPRGLYSCLTPPTDINPVPAAPPPPAPRPGRKP